MNQNNKKYLVLALAALPLLNSCSDSWLDPKPLSFYTPENTYVDAAGLYSALVACERNSATILYGRCPDPDGKVHRRYCRDMGKPTKAVRWWTSITRCFLPEPRMI